MRNSGQISCLYLHKENEKSRYRHSDLVLELRSVLRGWDRRMVLCKFSIKKKKKGKLKKQKAYYTVISDSFGWMSQTSHSPSNGVWDGSR